MRFRWKLGIFISLLPVAIEAVEVRDDLSFVKDRYAQQSDCATLQSSEKNGEQRSLNNAAWHLTKDGFSDGWEQYCTFHAVFMRDDTATATAICGEGAETTMEHFYFEQEKQSVKHPELYVYRKGDDTPEGRQGIAYSWCPIVKAGQ